jgi:hypothetical protein
MANIMEMLFGNTGGNTQQSLLTGSQGSFLEQLLSQLSQGGGAGQGMGNAMQLLQGLLDPSSEQYKNFEAPYLQEFNQQTIPGLAERFAGMGGGMGGGLSSSGFGQALGAAGSNLQTQLAHMKSQLQRQSVNDLFGQYNQMGSQALGTRAFENQYQPGTGGLVGSVLSAAAGGLGSGAGLGLGKGLGNMMFGGY